MKELKPQLFLSMKEYSGKQLAGDLTAGVIVAIIARCRLLWRWPPV